MQVRQLLDEPLIDKCPVIDDPELLVELMFMSNWEQITDCGTTATFVRKGDKIYILDMKETE